MVSTPFPTFDFARMSAVKSEEREAARQCFCAAIEQHGGCYITGVQDVHELNTRFMTAAEQFFQLPEEQKLEYEHPEQYGERGYIEKEREHVAPGSPADLKEFYSIGKEMASYDACEEKFFPNVWPDRVPEFQSTGLVLYSHLENIARQFLSYIADYYGEGVDYFDQCTRSSNHTLLRSIYFYPLDPAEEYGTAMRTAEHTDIGLITILMQGENIPLSFLVDDEWVPAQTQDAVFVYAGDMLERLTNGRVQALHHKAMNPPKVAMSNSAQLSAFYMHPHSHTDLIPFASCVDEQHPKQFEDSSAGAVLDDRLYELGLKY